MFTAAILLGITGSCVMVINGIYNMFTGTGGPVSFIIVLFLSIFVAAAPLTADKVYYYRPGLDQRPPDGQSSGVIMVVFTIINWFLLQPNWFFAIGPVLTVVIGIIILFIGSKAIPFNPNDGKNGRYID